MSARKISCFRNPRFIGVHRQAAADSAEALAGELAFSLRGKVKNTPTNYDDMPFSKLRLFYETSVGSWKPEFYETKEKIIRLRNRRISRSISLTPNTGV
jgi:hypothetical protein